MKNNIYTDVLVIGSGLAGVMAALSAAKEKATVSLASSGPVFSGSSFYPGTWGFGLIGPENDNDREDLKQVISSIGMGMTEPSLVDSLVNSVSDGIETLRSYGIALKDAEQKGEKAFIPCFDKKNRSWHGIITESAKEGFEKQLKKEKIALYPHTEIVKLIKRENKVTGAMGVRYGDGFLLFHCKSVIIASGGLGGLFKYRLNTADVRSTGQYLALDVGARLSNLEFSQMMPGFIKPAYQTIYNEKVFALSEFLDPVTGRSVFSQLPEAELNRLLLIRSTHGPFTSRLDSRVIDLCIFQHFIENKEGVILRYKKEIKKNQPEFVKVYFDWLEEAKHLTINDEIEIGIFFHASNGGICIDENGYTGVEGLYACGEATGGMHGADRLGGLSTANGLVFGKRAGQSAGVYAKAAAFNKMEDTLLDLILVPGARLMIERIREINFESAMIVRTESKLKAALEEIDFLEKQMENSKTTIFPEEEYPMSCLENILNSMRLQAMLSLSKAMLTAMRMRKESRGSHYRPDYEKTEDALARRIIISKKTAIKTEFKTKGC